MGAFKWVQGEEVGSHAPSPPPPPPFLSKPLPYQKPEHPLVQFYSVHFIKWLDEYSMILKNQGMQALIDIV